MRDSKIKFSSSADAPAEKPKRKQGLKARYNDLCGPVTVQKIEPKTPAKTGLSPVVAEALYRTGRLPSISR